jgi:cyclophilin family peptidyl-prolyl cis-trans isomerase/HEAT repeat protein
MVHADSPRTPPLRQAAPLPVDEGLAQSRQTIQMSYRGTIAGAVAVMALLAGCKSVPTAPPVTAPPPIPVAEITWAQKIGWIVQLEDQRLLRAASPPPRPILRPATETEPAVLGPAPPADLIGLLGDPDAPVRARAALAVGRVGLPEGVDPLIQLLGDPEAEVREQAAFGLGLLAQASARQALLSALTDASPLVQGRAAQALAAIGDGDAAAAVAAMVRGHVERGALADVAPDEIAHPLAPAAEAVRLGVYALARFGSFADLAAAVIRPDGEPVSRWWPIAFALQRIPDGQSTPWLLRLLDTPGRYTAAFAAKGLANRPSPEAIAALREIVARRQAHEAVIVQSLRTLSSAGDRAVVPALIRILGDRASGAALRGESAAALAALAGADEIDVLLELIADPQFVVRAAALRGLARVDGAAFLATVASLDADEQWTVRVALAQALGALTGARGVPRLRQMLNDEKDARVVPAILTALADAKAPDAESVALAQLQAPDFATRAAAARILADLDAVTALPALVQAYRQALADDSSTARAAMLEAVRRLEPAAAQPLIDEALQDADWALRLRAASIGRDAGAAADIAHRIRPAAPGRSIETPEWQAIVMPPYSPLAYLETTRGTIEVELAIADAPLTVANFVRLARSGFFRHVPIHRIVPDFVVQAGDPRGDGEGGPGYTLRDELNGRPFLRGTVGMALAGPDTGGSQFFITHSPQPHLDARYTVFGQVVRGMDVVDALAPGDAIVRVRIWDGVTND